MKHAFFITSSIELDPNRPFKGTKKRTVFSTEERLEQTYKTISACNQLAPDSTIFLIDSSTSHIGELHQ